MTDIHGKQTGMDCANDVSSTIVPSMLRLASSGANLPYSSLAGLYTTTGQFQHLTVSS